MPRRNLINERVLEEARERMDEAQAKVEEARHAFTLAGAELRAHTANYDALRAAFAPSAPVSTPKPASKKSGKKASKKAQDSEVRNHGGLTEICRFQIAHDVICGLGPDENIHHKSSEEGYHEFLEAA